MVEHFFTGIYQRWMIPLVDKPMVSVNNLSARRWKLRGKLAWADSGAFSAILKHGRYPWTRGNYLHWINYIEPTYYTQMDWPCEPKVRERSGLSVQEHIRLSVESAGSIEIGSCCGGYVPTIQGWEVADYLDCARQLEDAGLWKSYMAIGSICRRGQTKEICEVIDALKAFSPNTKFHGFGVKSDRKILDRLWSADSSAWSLHARFALNASREATKPKQAGNREWFEPYLLKHLEKARAWEAPING